jgi:hypothetical protein
MSMIDLASWLGSRGRLGCFSVIEAAPSLDRLYGNPKGVIVGPDHSYTG